MQFSPFLEDDDTLRNKSHRSLRDGISLANSLAMNYQDFNELSRVATIS